MRFSERPPDLGRMDRDRATRERQLNIAAGRVIDRKTKQAQERQRSVMSAARLGNLGKAVKAESGRSKDRKGNPNAYGVIYAEGGDESRAGQALQAYSRGTTIQPIKGNWLWYQSDALRRTGKIPGDTRRGRMTPERYTKMGSPIGKLEFAQISSRFAKLYVEVADISVRTGYASKPGKRASRSRVRVKRVTLFFGIKITRRGQRYDAQAIMRQTHNEIPAEIAREMAAVRAA